MDLRSRRPVTVVVIDVQIETEDGAVEMDGSLEVGHRQHHRHEPFGAFRHPRNDACSGRRAQASDLEEGSRWAIDNHSHMMQAGPVIRLRLS